VRQIGKPLRWTCKIQEKEADYVPSVKGNQGELHLQISTYSDEMAMSGWEPDLVGGGQQET